MTESTALTVLREELAPMKAEFGAVLPSHITADKFAQVCITAIENNPALLDADRQSFKVACLNAANDGLLPDKREGAFVIFNVTKERRTGRGNAVEKYTVPTVQWMPMITGILKKAYQTSKVASIAVEMVHKNDVYRRAAGDDAVIVHEPLDFGDRGPVIGAYSILTMKEGGVYREVMSKDQIEQVRNVSRAKATGPWVTFWEEMAKKTILRRLLKRVPISAEVDQVLARDDAFYNLDAERAPLLEAPMRAAIPKSALFGSRAHVKAQAVLEGPTAPEETAQEPQADEPPADEPEANRAVVEAVTAIMHAEELSVLVDLTMAAKEIECTDEERAWIDETVEASRKRLMGDVLADDDLPDALKGTGAGAAIDAAMERMETALYAKLSSSQGVRDYADANAWRDAILTKLASIKGDTAAQFWKVNSGYVDDALSAGVKQAERILEVAQGRGLT